MKKYKGLLETIIAFFLYVAVAGWVNDWNYSEKEVRLITSIIGIGIVGMTYLFSSGKIDNI